MKKIKAVILDFDGVLAESNAEKEAAFDELFALYPEYCSAMKDYHLAHRASPRRKKFAHYVEVLMGCRGDGVAIERMTKRFAEIVTERVIACPPVPGSIEFLSEFSKRVPLYISSVTPLDDLKKIIKARKIAGYIVETYGDPPTKKVDAINSILLREKIEPNEVAFIGDSPSDFHAAEQTGIVFFGRYSGQPFTGLEVELFRDLFQIAAQLRPLLS